MYDKQFITSFWAQYILLEKEFLDITNYVTIDSDNFNTFSNSFVKVILQICSEIDVIIKDYCKFHDSLYKNSRMDKHISFIKNMNNSLISDKIMVNNSDISLEPWRFEKGEFVPNWWTIYNKIKHERYCVVVISNERKYSYKFATLKTTLNCLAALYILLINYYYDLSIKYNYDFKTPIPGSKIFKLIGNKWDNIDFYDSFALYIDDNGHLVQVNSPVNY